MRLMGVFKRCSSSVVVHDLDIMRSAVFPVEAQTPLVIDPNAELTSAIAPEAFQAIPRRGAQEFQGLGSVQLCQFPFGHPLDCAKPFGASTLEQGLGVFAAEGSDQRQNDITSNVKREAS